MALELKDLIKDKIYYAEYLDQKLAIIKCTKNGSFKNAPGLRPNKTYLQINDWDCKSNIREANLEEQQWLEGCIKLNKYISLEESKKLHEISTYDLLATDAYGLKVGDKLDGKVINAWAEKDKNYYFTHWEKEFNCYFIGDRTIKSFKILDGIVGFEVSNTDKIYLKAEGFKEFAENFNKPNMKDILEECKKKFPIGTKYKCANSNNDDISKGSVNGVFEVKEYIIKKKSHFGVHSGNGWLHLNGKYAEIVSLPEQIIVEFEDVIFDKDNIAKICLEGTNSKQGDGIWNQIQYGKYKYEHLDLSKLWTVPKFQESWNKVRIKNRTKKEETIVQKRVKLRSNRKQFLNKTKNK